MIRLEAIELSLGSQERKVNVLRGLDLAVAAGETIAVEGPSGSGKTTMLMVIAGLERPTGGRVRVDDVELGPLNEDALARFRRDRVGIVFQGFHLIATMTALENVAVPLELAGRPDAFVRAREELTAVGLGRRLSHYPGELSGGEQQRVALARAFACEPRLLLADEPSGNLDPDTGHAVMDLMFAEVARRGTTLLLITHDPALALRCGRRLKLVEGRLVDEQAGDGRAGGGRTGVQEADGRRAGPLRMDDALILTARGGRTPGALALRFAWRELRGGIAGFRLFLACLALGVAIVAAVGSLAASLEAGIAADATRLLGGDLELRRVYRPLEPETLSFLQARGTLSTVIETRSMVRPVTGDAAPLLVELKAVDAPYPLVGQVDLDPPQRLPEALASHEGARGAVADPALFDRLGVRIGDRIRLGSEEFILTARLVSEPDRGATVFSLGPRLMIAADALPATGLLVPGSLVYYETRLSLPATATERPDALAKSVRAEFPNSDFRVRAPSDAGPGIKSFARRAALFLNFVGLAALLIGGVGVANAVGAYLEGKRTTIATLKCLGASAGLIARLYLALVLGLAAGGVLVGLTIGAAAPYVAAPFLAAHFSVPFRAAIHALPLAEAAALGLLAALAFAFLPLARARKVSAADLFRATAPRSIDLRDRLLLAGICLVLAGLTVLVSADKLLALGFVVAAALCYLLFRVLAQALGRLAQFLARRQKGHPALRLALANLARPGAPTTSVVLSLGLGLTVLVVVVLAQGSLHRQIAQTLPAVAPSFYFIDIQNDQAEPFRAAVGQAPGVTAFREVPMLRGRIAAVNGVAADRLTVPKDQQWVLQGDRGLTWSDSLPEGSRLTAGEWWPAGYQGPPLVSFEEEAAAALGLKPGDHVTISVLGREITAEVASIRSIRWTDLTINFVMVFSPGSFAGAPATWLATASLPPEGEAALAHEVGARFPNVSTIRVKDALAAVDGLLSAVGAAITATAGLALASGLLVLASAVLAEERRRIYEAVVLKVLGATRRDLARAFLLEQGLLGLVTGLLAILLGSIASWVLVTYGMGNEWSFSAPAVFAIALGGAALALLIGLGGTWRALSTPAAPHLRNE